MGVFDPSKNHPMLFESAIICSTVCLMCPSMSLLAAIFYYPYADGFSIKSRYINNDLVKRIHKEGKYVYAWTIDDSGILESMMLMNVDSIITNKPAEMRKAMYENYYGDTLIERINNFLDNEL
jgi:hypothetical protein